MTVSPADAVRRPRLTLHEPPFSACPPACLLAACPLSTRHHHTNCSTLQLIRTVANMLAPYAAVLYKFQQIQSTRLLLQHLLPPRVVAAAIDRLSIGGSGLVDAFGPTHVDLQPGPGG